MLSDLPIFATDKFAELAGLQIIQANRVQDLANAGGPRILGKWNDECFESPCVGTFGGFFNLNEENVYSDIQEILLELLKEKGNCKILVTLPSNHLTKLHPRVQAEAMVKLGAKELFHEINHVIAVKEWTTASLSRGNQKKLRQCNENQLDFKRLNLEEIDVLYEILRKNRESLGATVSMTLDQVRNAFETFPNYYFAFGVYSTGQMIAGAICLESAPKNLYVYMWGDLLEFRQISPIVFLCESLIDFSINQDIEFLDLGTSSIKGEIMSGVARFKENLGAEGYEKHSLSF